MRRFLIFSISALLINFIAVAAFAQQTSQTQTAPLTGLEGRWTGNIQVPNGGEVEMAAIFKKDKDVYAGTLTVTGMQGERSFKSVKIDGDTVKAQAEFETPNGNIVVNYTFTLKDDTLKGKGDVDLGGQNMVFDINLKRVTEK